MQSDFCFLWRKGGWRRGFSSPASSWVLSFAWSSGAFVSLLKSPVIFQKLLYTTFLPMLLLTQHILQELMSKRLRVVEFGGILWCSYSLQIFHEQGLFPVAKEWVCWPVWSLVWLWWFGMRGKNALNIFNKLYLWVLYCCFAVLLLLQILPVPWQKTILGYNSGETWKYISLAVFSIVKVTSTPVCLLGSSCVHS